MASSSSFTDALRSFDSHERGILLQWATGTEFALSDDLRNELAALLPVQVPKHAFVAMDYALDWVYAALRRFMDLSTQGPQPWPDGGQLAASLEDVDLLVAWEDERPHLLLIEAKGYTGWGNQQLFSKAKRIGAIFDEETRRRVDVHFVLVGPKRSAGIDTSSWPAWLHNEGRYHFAQLPDPGERFAVQRCTAEGKATQTGWTHWQTVKRNWT